jgi:hypothetical protein
MPPPILPLAVISYPPSAIYLCTGAMALTGFQTQMDDMNMSQLWHAAIHQAGIEMSFGVRPDMVIAHLQLLLVWHTALPPARHG